MINLKDLKNFFKNLKNPKKEEQTRSEQSKRPSLDLSSTNSPSKTQFQSKIHKIKNLENQFFSSYSKNTISSKLPDLSNCLINTKISKNIRSKMIDWKIEIYINLLKEYIDIDVLFKSIQIMDLYTKLQKKKILVNEDIHLLGITSIYLSSKYFSKNLSFFKELIPIVTYNKYDIVDCEKKEKEILKTLNFKISQPTILDLLNQYLNRFFKNIRSNDVKELKNISINFLFMIFIDEKFNNKNIDLVVNACLINAMRYYFSSILDKNCSVKAKTQIYNQEKIVVKSIFVHFKKIVDVLKKETKCVKNHLVEFEENFRNMNNVKKLFIFRRSFLL